MTSIDDQLLSTFRRALRAQISPGNFNVDQLPEWDSLTHIKLIMELEMAFGISIGPDDIPRLYSDFDEVKNYVMKAQGTE